MEGSMATPASIQRLWSLLIATTVAYVALVAAHDLDHIVNEGNLYDLPAFFWVLLPFQYAVILGVAALVIRRDRRGPLLAGVLGLLAAVLFVVLHAVPFGPAAYSDTDAGFVDW